MRPYRFDGADHTLQLPGGTEENDLPSQIVDGWTVSRWRMTDEEREAILANGLIVAWLWWPNLIGVQLRIDGVTAPDEPTRHTEETMTFSGVMRDEGGQGFYSLVATLSEWELNEIRDGANVELRVDMHPTCPVAVGAAEFE